MTPTMTCNKKHLKEFLDQYEMTDSMREYAETAAKLFIEGKEAPIVRAQTMLAKKHKGNPADYRKEFEAFQKKSGLNTTMNQFLRLSRFYVAVNEGLIDKDVVALLEKYHFSKESAGTLQLAILATRAIQGQEYEIPKSGSNYGLIHMAISNSNFCKKPQDFIAELVQVVNNGGFYGVKQTLIEQGLDENHPGFQYLASMIENYLSDRPSIRQYRVTEVYEQAADDFGVGHNTIVKYIFDMLLQANKVSLEAIEFSQTTVTRYTFMMVDLLDPPENKMYRLIDAVLKPYELNHRLMGYEAMRHIIAGMVTETIDGPSTYDIYGRDQRHNVYLNVQRCLRKLKTEGFSMVSFMEDKAMRVRVYLEGVGVDVHTLAPCI